MSLALGLENRGDVLHRALVEGSKVELGAEAGINVPLPVRVVARGFDVHGIPGSAQDPFAARRGRVVVDWSIDQVELHLEAVLESWTAAAPTCRELGQLLGACNKLSSW